MERIPRKLKKAITAKKPRRPMTKWQRRATIVIERWLKDMTRAYSIAKFLELVPIIYPERCPSGGIVIGPPKNTRDYVVNREKAEVILNTAGDLKFKEGQVGGMLEPVPTMEYSEFIKLQQEQLTKLNTEQQ